MKRLDLKTGMVRAECETETALYPLCYDSNTLGIDHVGHGFLGAQGRWRRTIRLPHSPGRL